LGKIFDHEPGSRSGDSISSSGGSLTLRSAPFRTARPGDLFILLVPTGEELSELRRRQHELLQRFGGQAAVNLHVTCERFHLQTDRSRPLPEAELEASLLKLRMRLQSLRSFSIFSNGLVSYYAPFWKTHVLRWRVVETGACLAFRKFTHHSLEESGGHSHYVQHNLPTCNALVEVGVVRLSPEESHQPPFLLFTARQVRISRLQAGGVFQTLHLFELG